jgi:hypothetical protein
MENNLNKFLSRVILCNNLAKSYLPQFGIKNLKLCQIVFIGKFTWKNSDRKFSQIKLIEENLALALNGKIILINFCL